MRNPASDIANQSARYVDSTPSQPVSATAKGMTTTTKGMTRREAAVISAYTGVLIGDSQDMYAYFDELMGFPVQTISDLFRSQDEIKRRAAPEFMDICKRVSELPRDDA